MKRLHLLYVVPTYGGADREGGSFLFSFFVFWFLPLFLCFFFSFLAVAWTMDTDIQVIHGERGGIQHVVTHIDLK